MSGADTDLGGADDRFPRTRWTILRGAADTASPECRASLEHLARLYWRPVYAYVRRKWNRSNEEAKDLAQEFFAALCEKEILARLSPERGRFRSYVMAALDNFVRERHRADSAQKRGGGAIHLSLDAAEGFEPAAGDPPERVFLREWARTLVEDAAAQMEREGGKGYPLLLARDLDPPADGDVSYETLAERFGLSVADVTVTLYRARQRLRALVLERIRDTVTTEEEAEAEFRDLFGR